MKTLTISMLAVLGSILISQTAMAESKMPAQMVEPHPGKALHEASNCLKCHASKPYNPEKTDSFPKLVKSVQFCNDNLNTGLFEDEVEQLADYLNDTYYHHPKE